MFLHSFGQNFSGRRKPDGHIKSEARQLKFCKDTNFFNKSEFIIDSGGFQIGIGRLSRDEGKTLIELYHRFLVEHDELYERARITSYNVCYTKLLRPVA